MTFNSEFTSNYFLSPGLPRKLFISFLLLLHLFPFVKKIFCLIPPKYHIYFSQSQFFFCFGIQWWVFEVEGLRWQKIQRDSLLFFEEPQYHFSEWLVHVTFQPTVYKSSNFSTSSPTLGIVCLSYSSHPTRLKWSLIVIIPVLLTCPFPLAPEDFIRVFYNLHLAAGKLPFSSVTSNMK